MSSKTTRSAPGSTDPFAHVPEFALRLFRTEPVASTVRRWHELRIPGPFQSPELIVAAHRARDAMAPLPFTEEEALAQRDERREALLSPHLSSCHVVLYEEALHRVAACLGPDVASAQARFLTEVVDRRATWCDARTSVAILPRASRLLFAPGDLTMLTFAPDASEQDFIYSEYEFGIAGGVDANYVTDPALLASANETWKRLTGYSLDPDSTRELLTRLPGSTG
ncbi:Scr1 family TA system antitoxin-like transcriptional regulator [Amycolatopsis sp. cmx-4-61]|uniref:Scr1 family TA system antitoxin-like transcriptional regulator n=1 Tax=Amycolatopsis sp. cmx-4-61 TaxID=2790937 RepID=UPI00397B44C7